MTKHLEADRLVEDSSGEAAHNVWPPVAMQTTTTSRLHITRQRVVYCERYSDLTTLTVMLCDQGFSYSIGLFTLCYSPAGAQPASSCQSKTDTPLQWLRGILNLRKQLTIKITLTLLLTAERADWMWLLLDIMMTTSHLSVKSKYNIFAKSTHDLWPTLVGDGEIVKDVDEV